MADERVTKSDVLDALKFFKDDADTRYLTDANILQPVIQVTCESSDVTVTKSGVNYPATSHNGNIHIFTVDDYGTYDITATSAELGFSRTASVKVDAVKVYKTTLNFRARYGYRIKKAEADPYARVEYLYDAEGMTPAHMDFDNGVFDYGDWGGIWFVADNKPCMLKSDGTVDYYLDPNDYTKKADGTASDVANIDYDGNAMAQFPLCWVYRYETDDYLYEIISNVQYDENYKAYAHTDASGNIKDYFYRSLFGTSYSSSKLRSIKGLALSRDANMANGIAYATANGSGWHIGSWSQFSLIRTLLVLISKSTDSQASFGNGNYQGAVYLTTGTLSNAGQFYGYTSENQQVKCFHVEGLWGDSTERLAGHFNSSGNRYVKMTPEGQGYFANAVTGYTNLGAMTVSGQSGVYITNMTCNEYGLFPATSSGGSSATYFCDMYTYWADRTFTAYQASGATTTTAGDTPKGGVFFVSFSIPVSERHEQIGYSLSYV